MNALTVATPKVVKLIPLLGSDKPGEVVAAAGAIGRTLKGAGCDWHDLAEVVERGALPVVQPHQEAPPAPELKPWQVLAMACIRAGTGRLKPVELDFLRGMVHWPDEPSEKQARWLYAIAGALGIEVTA